MNKRLIKSNDEGPTGPASFNTVLYTGNGGTQAITGVGFQPDLVWTKSRTDSYDPGIQDSVRGVNSLLYPSLAEQETITSTATQSFDSDGFTYGSSNKGNVNAINYVAWCWKAAGYANTFNVLENGSTTSSATAGGAGITAVSITNCWSVSANRDAGFSIVSYTGTGNPEIVGHGLGVAPSIYIIKNRDAAIDWTVLTNIIDGSMYFLFLNQNAAAGGAGESQPTSTTFNELGNSYVGASGNDYIAYCFAEVAGFSKFGIYTGTGAAGNAQTLGFDPAFIIFKSATGAIGYQWWIHDNKRGDDKRLFADSNAAESTSGSLTTNATGFSFNDSNNNLNASGVTYIYMAFANQF